jgi:hypothetical protein
MFLFLFVLAAIGAVVLGFRAADRQFRPDHPLPVAAKAVRYIPDSGWATASVVLALGIAVIWQIWDLALGPAATLAFADGWVNDKAKQAAYTAFCLSFALIIGFQFFGYRTGLVGWLIEWTYRNGLDARKRRSLALALWGWAAVDLFLLRHVGLASQALDWLAHRAADLDATWPLYQTLSSLVALVSLAVAVWMLASPYLRRDAAGGKAS